MDCISASRIKTFRTCPRKFWYKYVKGHRPDETEAMIRGSEIHKDAEDFYEDPEHELSEPTLLEANRQGHFPPRQAVHSVEKDIQDFGIKIRGLKLLGYIDLLYWYGPKSDPLLTVRDWKTRSGFSYAPGPNELRSNVQMVLYGRAAFEMFPEIDRLRLEHCNLLKVPKGGPRSKVVQTTVDRDHIQQEMEQVAETVDQIKETVAKEKTKHVRQEIGQDSCFKYGPCYAKTDLGCHQTPYEPESVSNQSRNARDDDMSGFDPDAFLAGENEDDEPEQTGTEAAEQAPNMGHTEPDESDPGQQPQTDDHEPEDSGRYPEWVDNIGDAAQKTLAMNAVDAARDPDATPRVDGMEAAVENRFDRWITQRNPDLDEDDKDAVDKAREQTEGMNTPADDEDGDALAEAKRLFRERPQDLNLSELDLTDEEHEQFVQWRDQQDSDASAPNIQPPDVEPDREPRDIENMEVEEFDWTSPDGVGDATAPKIKEHLKGLGVTDLKTCLTDAVDFSDVPKIGPKTAEKIEAKIREQRNFEPEDSGDDEPEKTGPPETSKPGQVPPKNSKPDDDYPVETPRNDEPSDAAKQAAESACNKSGSPASDDTVLCVNAAPLKGADADLLSDLLAPLKQQIESNEDTPYFDLADYNEGQKKLCALVMENRDRFAGRTIVARKTTEHKRVISILESWADVVYKAV